MSNKKKKNAVPLSKAAQLAIDTNPLQAIAPTVKEHRTSLEPWAGQKYSEVSRLTEDVFIGDYVDGRDLELHTQHGIDAIVNCTNEPHPHDHLPMLTLKQQDFTGLDWGRLDAFFVFMDEQKKLGHTVLIHCALGINRAPTFATAWIMRERQWTWNRALEYVKFRRRIAQPDRAQAGTVTAYFLTRYPHLVLTDDGNR